MRDEPKNTIRRLAGECPMVSAAALIGVTLSSWSRVEHLALRSLQATK
jgi:hypothetical protein